MLRWHKYSPQCPWHVPILYCMVKQSLVNQQLADNREQYIFPWPIPTFCKVDIMFWSYLCTFWTRNISSYFKISHIIFQVGYQFCSFHNCAVVGWDGGSPLLLWQEYPTLILSLDPFKWILMVHFSRNFSSAPNRDVYVLFRYNALRTFVLLHWQGPKTLIMGGWLCRSFSLFDYSPVLISHFINVFFI